MPLFRSGLGRAPRWSELECFDIVRLRAGEGHTFQRVATKEKLLAGIGSCRLTWREGERLLNEGDCFDLEYQGDDAPVVISLTDATVVRLCGRWGVGAGTCGVFTLTNSDSPLNEGDPSGYPRSTRFDNHYHDCDEYWVIFDGRAIAVSERKMYILGPGDCLATGMGHHHDLVQVIEPLKGVYCETTLGGEARPGHLWEHTHGPAEPRQDRV